MITVHERVAREDLVTFINACFACSGQREFYSDDQGQAVSIDFLHAYVAGNYRRLYARTLAAGVNHFNRARIVTELLASSRHLDPGELQCARMRAVADQGTHAIALSGEGAKHRRPGESGRARDQHASLPRIGGRCVFLCVSGLVTIRVRQRACHSQ